MIGAMQDWPLLVWRLIDHAARYHGSREIVTLRVEGDEHRTNWREVRDRSKRTAQALTRLGVQTGDRVATLAWNTHRHVECWYGISGMGAVAHTINPRLFAEQISWIANHAEDQVLFFDLTFLKTVEAIAPKLATVRHFIAMTDRAHMPESSLPLLCYEDLLAAEDGNYTWADLDERAPAGLCYTSGTTGNPKGVLYSHRSNLLHTFGGGVADVFGIGSASCILPVVQMYHANAWGLPYIAAAAGAKLVLTGPNMDPPTTLRMMLQEGVTLSAAVPTVWLGILADLEKTGGTLGKLERVVIGGSAAPRSMIDTLQRVHGVSVAHLWGMTEMSPVGTVGGLTAAAQALPYEQQLDLLCKQGRPIFGVEMKIIDDDGNDLPNDGVAYGHLMVRGPWVIERYFRGDGGDVVDGEGWFDTGDIATLDADGYMQITDRSKDVIKSGGEWISSIELENAAVGHPLIVEAAVIGVPHPRWDERPLLVVIKQPGSTLQKAEVLAFLSDKVAKWWLPDDVVFVEELPHTATGKLLKTALRDQYKHHLQPVAS